MASFKEKITEFVKKHKVKIIIYASLFVVAIIVAAVLLESTYEYIVSGYEKDSYNIYVCEEGISTFKKMRFYKQSDHYINQMKKTGIEGLCKDGRFEDAKNFLNRNYDESLEDMYSYIDTASEEYEKEQARIEYNSTEGRTKRVKTMYETMGIGGVQTTEYIIQQLDFYLEYGTIEDIGNIFPVWNRNEIYLDMVKSDIKRGFNLADYHFTTDEFMVAGKKFTEWDKKIYKDYLKRTYNINIDVQEVYLEPCYVHNLYNGGQSTSGITIYVIEFATEGRWFFGGFITKLGLGDENDVEKLTVNDIKPVSTYYEGQLIDELED
ncbi:MAG: hypothetical protein IJ619_08740 [Eubacterium sp.]|nr:hypothetical protein [Eubacterium sp.]